MPALRREYSLPARLLGIGLPLTIAAGWLVGVGLFSSFSLAELLILAVILAPTDAALGQEVVIDQRLPSRIRQGLNVESGLNDGICVPLLFIALAIAEAESGAETTHGAFTLVVDAIGYGLLFGVVAGVVGGVVARFARQHGLMDSEWSQILPVATAALAYGLAAPLGGSGFIAAFVAGFAYGKLHRDEDGERTQLLGELGGLANCVTFLVFGAAIAGTVLADLTWRAAVYGVLSLTVVRMVPVAVALIGTHARVQTVAFVGWFGPRGLASIVFTVIALETGSLAHASEITVAVGFTIVLSVYLHGLSAKPLDRPLCALVPGAPRRSPPGDGKRARAGPALATHRGLARVQRHRPARLEASAGLASPGRGMPALRKAPMNAIVGPAAAAGDTEPDRVPALLQMQRELLVKAASGAETRDVLRLLIELIEAYVPDAIGSVLLVDPETRTLQTLVGPRLPGNYSAAIDGVAIADGAGSCGTAAARKRTVVVEDIATDPLWDAFRELALEHGLRACWSTPIVDGLDQVIGTFALYYDAVRRPTESDLELVDVAAGIASIVLERERALASATHEAAERSEIDRRYRTLVEQLPLVIYADELDAVSSNIFTSRQIEDILGYPVSDWHSDEMLFVKLLHPEDRDRVLAAHDRTHRDARAVERRVSASRARRTLGVDPRRGSDRGGRRRQAPASPGLSARHLGGARSRGTAPPPGALRSAHRPREPRPFHRAARPCGGDPQEVRSGRQLSCSSISTTSRASTTGSGIRPATPLCRRLRSSSSRSSARVTPLRVWAVTSSG